MTEQRTDAAPKRPAWLTEDCPPWCLWDGNGGEHFRHYDRDEYGDRIHTSDAASTTLTATDAPALSYDGKREVFDSPVEVRTYLIQHYREAEPRVHLGEDDLPGMFLTLAEAEQLAHQVLEQVAAARGQA